MYAMYAYLGLLHPKWIEHLCSFFDYSFSFQEKYVQTQINVYINKLSSMFWCYLILLLCFIYLQMCFFLVSIL